MKIKYWVAVALCATAGCSTAPAHATRTVRAGAPPAPPRPSATARAPRIAGITPSAGEKVGVGMPIIVDFARPVTDRTDARKALRVTADKGDEGAWRWLSSRRIVYRTRTYWQPHQTVTFTAHTNGHDVTRTFTVGATNITVANARTHSMKVSHDGRVRHFPISTGKGTERQYVTTNGIHLTREKSSVVTMRSPGCAKDQTGCEYYREQVHLAVRITLGGEYVHQSVGEYQYLGRQNESHGCVRTSPAGARYFYDISQRGDIVNVTGTSRRFADEPYADEWTFWTHSWAWWSSVSGPRSAPAS